MAKKLNGHVPKNTNQFLHLITKDSSIGLGGMKWVYKLRDYKVEDETKNKNEEEKNQKKLKQLLILNLLLFLKMIKKDIKIEIEEIKDHFQQIIILVLFVI